MRTQIVRCASSARSASICAGFTTKPFANGVCPGRRYGELTGILSQRVSATPYLGDRVRLRASVRVEGKHPGCAAYVWVRCVKPGLGPSAEIFYQSTDRPITDSEWREVELTGDVPQDAKSLDFGLALVGYGTAWIDSVSLEALGAAPSQAEGRAP